MTMWPSNTVIDQTFPDNDQGLITAATMRNFQKQMTQAGRSTVIYPPFEYGAPTDGVSPASAGIQAAIDQAYNDGGGIVWFDASYAIDTPIVMKRGVSLLGNASFNRRVFPDVFHGNELYMHESNSARELLNIGTFGNADNNPQATMIEGVCFNGKRQDTSDITDIVGVYVRDTSDTYFRRCCFGGFDRAGSTGYGIIVEGTGEGNCFGTIADNNIYSNSQHGITYIGLGTTDMRHSNNLYVGCTRAMSLGYDDRGGTTRNEGGAGMQCVNDHFTYTGMPAQGWFIRSGSQGGTLFCNGAYFDQHGDAFPVRLGNAKAKIWGCHFLMAAVQDEKGLVRIGTAGSQETQVYCNSIDMNGSALQSLVHWAAGSGLPNNINVTSNNVYGVGTNWKGHVTDNQMTVYDNVENDQTVIKFNTRRG